MACGLDGELVWRLGVGCVMQMLQHVRVCDADFRWEPRGGWSLDCKLQCCIAALQALRRGCPAAPLLGQALGVAALSLFPQSVALETSCTSEPWPCPMAGVASPGVMLPGVAVADAVAARPSGAREAPLRLAEARMGWLGSALCRPGVSAGGGSCTYA